MDVARRDHIASNDGYHATGFLEGIHTDYGLMHSHRRNWSAYTWCWGVCNIGAEDIRYIIVPIPA